MQNQHPLPGPVRRARIPAVLLVVLGSVLSLVHPAAAASRIKDVARIEGVRSNHLMGYGVVVGLKGTGDRDFRGVAPQSVASLLARLGIRLSARDLRLRNVAAVMVTAQLPAFARPGDTLDVNVSSIGDARSLAGGNLIATPLSAANGAVFAVAQGGVTVGGYDATQGMNHIYKNHATSGRVPAGAVIERASPSVFTQNGKLRFVLKRADFTTAQRAAQSIEAALVTAFPEIKSTPTPASTADGGTVEDAGSAEDAAGPVETNAFADNVVAKNASLIEILVPDQLVGREVELVAAAEAAQVEVDRRAVVVISERTGTVVLGADVRIAPVAIAHGGLEIEIRSTPMVSQPNAFGQGSSQVVDVNRVDAKEAQATLKALQYSGEGASVADLATAVNALGATPRDLLIILEAIRSAGALEAELVVQ